MTFVYAIVLFVHSYLRWAVLGAALVVLARTLSGSRAARRWEKSDERWHAALLGLVDLQFLLGLSLYTFLSPITSAFFASPGRMKDPVLRFFGVEHLFMMVLAVAIFHAGRTRSKKAPVERRHHVVWKWTLGALVLTLAGIPWPFFPAGRPVLRGFAAPAAPVAHVPAAVPGAAPSCPPVYRERCATCHGEQGRGDGVAAQSLRPPPRDFAVSDWAAQRSDADIAAVIREGGAARGLSALMPPHAGLGKQDVDALVACVRSFRAGPAMK
jgi:hypothetical protein